MNKPTPKPTKKVADEKQSLISPNTIIKLIIPKNEAQQAYKKALGKLAKKIKIDGFRKGNVPPKIAEENLNPQQIIEDALQLVVPEIYSREIVKKKLHPLTMPMFDPISLNKGEDWIIEAHIAEKPEVDLKSYKEIVRKAKKNAGSEIEKQLKEMEKLEKKKDKDKDKDTKKEGRIEKKTLTETEKKDFTLQYIYRDLIQTIRPKVQELLVKEEVNYDLESLSHRLKHMNIPFERFLEHRKMTIEDLSSELTAGALGRLQMSFIIDKIARTEKIEVSSSDLDAEFEKIKDKEVREKQKADSRYVDMMNQTIIRNKVADFLFEIK